MVEGYVSGLSAILECDELARMKLFALLCSLAKGWSPNLQRAGNFDDVMHSALVRMTSSYYELIKFTRLI